MSIPSDRRNRCTYNVHEDLGIGLLYADHNSNDWRNIPGEVVNSRPWKVENSSSNGFWENWDTGRKSDGQTDEQTMLQNHFLEENVYNVKS